MTKIKLQRLGKRSQALYRIVVIDEREKVTGRPLEVLGNYNPNTNPYSLKFDSKRLAYWISVGAQPTDTIRKLLKIGG